jgi:predicted MPP superfamily phosphohydrolase
MAEQLTIADEQHNQLDEQSRLRPYVGKAALVLGSGILGMGAGLGYAAATPAEVTVGGMEASVEIAHGATSEVDLGLMGSVIVPKSTTIAGADIGVKVTINGLKDERTTEAIGDNTINSFLQLFSDPEYELNNVKTAVSQHMAAGAYFGGTAGVVAGGMTMGAAHILRRRMSTERREAFEQAFALSRRSKLMAAGAASFAVIAAGATWTLHEMPASSETTLAANPIFENTPLAGAELTGLLKPTVGTVAPAIQKYIKDNDSFYDEATKNFEAQFASTIGAIERQPSEVFFLTASDRHCNIGMDRVIAKVAEQYDAKIYLTAGDDNMSGTVAIESACTAGVAQRLLKQDATLVSVRGNHDSLQTEKDEKNQGYTVLDGNRIVDVDGLRIIGDGDPRRSAFGHPMTPDGVEGERVLKEQSEAFRDTACGHTDGIDVALIHEPASAEDIITSGCVPLIVTGHTHNWKTPVPVMGENGNTVYHFSEGTTGGAKEQTLTLGPLKTDATMTVFRFDTKTKAFAYSKVTVKPDRGVAIGQFTPMPELPKQQAVKKPAKN